MNEYSRTYNITATSLQVSMNVPGTTLLNPAASFKSPQVQLPTTVSISNQNTGHSYATGSTLAQPTTTELNKSAVYLFSSETSVNQKENTCILCTISINVHKYQPSV